MSRPVGFDAGVRMLRDALVAEQTRGRARLGASRESLEALKRAAASSRAARAPVLKRVLAPIPAPTPAETAKPRPAGAGGKREALAAFRERVLGCAKCAHLAATRTQVVFGVGNPDAELMFVGEAPGADEDARGEPFVGRAGQMLTKIIAAMGLGREDVYIANVLKCRPDMPAGSTGNRRPRPDEMATCLPYLREQIGIIRPKVLVALGSVAMEGLFARAEPMGRLRGRWFDFEGIPTMATYHPAYLLRKGGDTNTEKRKVWEDMLQVLERLGHPISAKQRAFFLPK